MCIFNWTRFFLHRPTWWVLANYLVWRYVAVIYITNDGQLCGLHIVQLLPKQAHTHVLIGVLSRYVAKGLPWTQQNHSVLPEEAIKETWICGYVDLWFRQHHVFTTSPLESGLFTEWVQHLSTSCSEQSNTVVLKLWSCLDQKNVKYSFMNIFVFPWCFVYNFWSLINVI